MNGPSARELFDHAPASDTRTGFRRLQKIYCARRDGELIALRLEAMSAGELLEVTAKLLARSAYEEATELLTWLRARGGAS
jgi:hypothetical protein